MTSPEQFLDARPEPKRDRFGRYLMPHPTTGKTQAWTRATTFASSVADTFGLTKWQVRMAARGLASRPDLLAGVAAVADPEGSDGKRALDKLCESAKEAAGASSRATLGTALHSFTEAHDLGRPVTVPEPYDADVAAYAAAMAQAGAAIDPAHVERIVCLPDLGVAGTFDRLVSIGGRLVVADLKTGRDLSYAWTEIAIQLALYANAATIYDAVTGAHEPMPAVDKDKALVMHLPVGEATCTLHEVDIAAGWEMAQVCATVRAWRKRRDLARPLAVTAPTPTEAPADRTAWVKDRIEVLRGIDGALAALAQRWPEGIAPPKEVDRWSDDDLAVVLPALELVESRFRAPFPEASDPDAPPRPTPAPIEPPVPAAPALVALDDGPALPEGTFAEIKAHADAELADGRRYVASRWAGEGQRHGRPWTAEGGVVHERHAAVLHAAIACAAHLYDEDDGLDGLTRAALAMVLGEEVQPAWRTGAALGSLTTAQAKRLAEIAALFAQGDAPTCAEVLVHVPPAA